MVQCLFKKQNRNPHNTSSITTIKTGSVQHWFHRWHCVPDETLFDLRRDFQDARLVYECLCDNVHTLQNR